MKDTTYNDLPQLRAQRARLVAAVWEAAAELAEFDTNYPGLKIDAPELFQGARRDQKA